MKLFRRKKSDLCPVHGDYRGAECNYCIISSNLIGPQDRDALIRRLTTLEHRLIQETCLAREHAEVSDPEAREVFLYMAERIEAILENES